MAAKHHNIPKPPPPHVLLFPYPSQGHINPIIQFAKRLLSKGLRPTLVTTIYLFNSTLTHNNNNNNNSNSIQIKTISDGFDEGGYATADSPESYMKTFKETGSKSLSNLIKNFQNEGDKIDAIVYDSMLIWALDVAKGCGIKAGSFFTQACGVNSVYYHVYKGLITLPLSETEVVCVPGLPQLEKWETPSFVQDYDGGGYTGFAETVFSQFINIHQAKWVFTTSFYQLEEEVIEWMRKMWNLKVIGPTIPSMYLDKQIEDDNDYGFSLYKVNHDECIIWLNDKPKKSVVYVSFGSSVKFVPEQMEEIAWALSDSDVNFLWVVRAKEEDKLPKDFVNILKTGKGLVVTWCKQLDVLAHESVGCFVTHCGFNSTLEAISLGVPVVGMPHWSDQITNAKCLDEIWDVGVRVKADENGIVRRGNLVSCIKTIMEEEKGAVARKNAAKWRALAKGAVEKGGSSDKDIDEFVYELKDAC